MNYWKTGDVGEVFLKNCEMALKNGEPGFSFNFFEKEDETLRNACTEVSSSDDSDVCNLGSLNFAAIKDINELKDVVELATKFLLCGTLKAELPYEKIYEVREKNRRLGLGIMGLHEWLIQRKSKYEVTPELHTWLALYEHHSNHIARDFADHLAVSRPVAVRAVAPTGSISMLASTTSGIEPLYAVAYKRRYLVNGNRWKHQYNVDHTAMECIQKYGVDPDSIETSVDLAIDYERRIKFNADVQDYVDMSISSTLNLTAPGSIDTKEFAKTLATYAPRLRGFTCYPDGARGGQPLTKVSFYEAKDKLGEEFDEGILFTDVCDLNGTGFCGT
jgi:ribonucleoside-diphosphate reductase alpha chain